jgi:hypothetical protein
MRRKLLLASAWLLIGTAAPAHALIIAPDIDAADYAQLRSEVLTRIPDYAPEWTEHNESDPGAALLELFAFTAEDLAYRVGIDVPDDLLWDDFDADEESTLGAVAYLLLDAAYLARYGTDVREPDWLEGEGVDPQWTYAELRAAAVRSVPEPAPLALLAAGFLLLALKRRFLERA